MIELININTEFIKLDQFLKFIGLFQTCGIAKQLILDGKVYVNNAKCLQRGKKLYNGYSVSYNNKEYKVIYDNK